MSSSPSLKTVEQLLRLKTSGAGSIDRYEDGSTSAVSDNVNSEVGSSSKTTLEATIPPGRQGEKNIFQQEKSLIEMAGSMEKFNYVYGRSSAVSNININNCHERAQPIASIPIPPARGEEKTCKEGKPFPEKQISAESCKNGSTKKGRGRPKGRKTTKHPTIERPKRPMSAYNIYFRDERRKIIEGDGGKVDISFMNRNCQSARLAETKKQLVNVNLTANGKVNYPDLAKIIGPKWRSLDDETRSKYESLANIEMEKYKEAMKVYNKKVNEMTEEEKHKKFKTSDVEDKPEAPYDTSYIGHNMQYINGVRNVSSSFTIGSHKTLPPATLPPLPVDQNAAAAAAVARYKARIMGTFGQIDKPLLKGSLTPNPYNHHNNKASEASMTTSLAIGHVMADSEDHRNIAQILDQQTRLAAAVSNNSAGMFAQQFYQGKTGPETVAAATKLTGGISGPLSLVTAARRHDQSAAGLSSLSPPPPIQSGSMSDTIVKRAMDLEAAKRLVEEREQQLTHELAMEAIRAQKRQRLGEEQKLQALQEILRSQQNEH